jgi:hypothetical protein
MTLEPRKLHFRPNEKVSSLELGPSLRIDTYFSENPNGCNIPTKKKGYTWEVMYVSLRCCSWLNFSCFQGVFLWPWMHEFNVLFMDLAYGLVS